MIATCPTCSRTWRTSPSVNLVNCPCGTKLVPDNSEPPIQVNISRGGVGTELEKLLGWFVQPTRDCGCSEKAKTLDSWGPAICAQRIDQILDMLQDSAAKLELPFLRSVARPIVKLAIRNASKHTE